MSSTRAASLGELGAPGSQSRHSLSLQWNAVRVCSFLVPSHRVYWDVLMLTILSINVTFLPVAIAFFKQNIEPGWVAFNCISDFLFIIDIILHFYTGIITADNTVLLDLKQIRIMYLKKWFAIDLISVFPFDYIVLGITESVQVNDLLRASRALRLLRLIKLLSLLRLLKLIRFLRYLTKWEEVRDTVPSIYVHNTCHVQITVG